MRRGIGFCLLASLVAACAASGGVTAPPVPTAPSSAATVVPPQASDVSVPSVGPSSPGVEWELLWVSDSTGSGGVAAAYARRIEAAEGVQVRVHDAWAGSLTARTVLRILQGQDGGVLRTWASGDVNLRDAVREAEVIVISGGFTDSPTPGHPSNMLQACPAIAPAGSACPVAVACGPETWAQYETDMVAIFDEVFALRDGRPVILRTHDWYLPWGPRSAWETCSVVQPCSECHRQLSEAIHRAAETHGVPVAGYFAAFAGPSLDTPLPSAWQRDELHPSAEGAEHLADVMASLGFDPVAPVGG